jgi:uncharacterized protein YuzE
MKRLIVSSAEGATAGPDSRAIVDGMVADLDGDGNVVGLDFEHASEKLDLQSLETVSLPALTTKIA